MEESFSLEEVVLAALPEKVAGAKDEIRSETRAPCLAGATLESHREKPFVWFCLNLNRVCIVCTVCVLMLSTLESHREQSASLYRLNFNCVCIVYVCIVHSVFMLF